MKNTGFNDHFLKKMNSDSELRSEIEDAHLFIDISMQLHALRKECRLTQKEMAERSGLPQSNISRLESMDYQGYTLKVLAKVVRALGGKLRVEIVMPAETTVTDRHDFLSESRHVSSLKRVEDKLITLDEWKRNTVSREEAHVL